MIKIGIAGIGGFKEAPKNLEHFHKLGITAAEIAFTYSIYLSNQQAKTIGQIAKKFNIDLSIHAPYWLNLVSKEKIKIKQSKQRILTSCERAHYLGAKYVVFHCGFYQGRPTDQIYEGVKAELKDIQKTTKKLNVKLAPETTGKASQFGSIDELINLNKEINTFFCIDFAHIKARNIGKINYDELFKKLKKFKHLHCHFSGINYTKKGERNHEPTKEKDIKELLQAILKHKVDCTIINESPAPVKDCIKTIEILKKLK